MRSKRPVETLDANVAGSVSPFDVTLAHERHNQIEAAIFRLPAEYRTVLVLRHFGEHTYDEIAEALEIPESLVKSRLYTARQLLGEMLLGWKQLSQETKR
jgi:RNA polymerase sigma-70 factor (ECF subfamily)